MPLKQEVKFLLFQNVNIITKCKLIMFTKIHISLYFIILNEPS